MISIRKLKRFGIPHRHLRMKGIVLTCLLLLLTIAAMGCKRSNDIEKATPSSKEEHIMTGEPDTTTVPTSVEELDPTLIPTPINEPEPTIILTPTDKPDVSVPPTPTKEPVHDPGNPSDSDFIPSEEVLHSATALTQGNYLFYKTGKLTKTVITSKNLKTSKKTELTIIEDSRHDPGEFYLKGRNIYYHEGGDIYRVGVDGTNKTKLYNGTATILGLYRDDVIAIERKTRELIRISKEGEKKSLTKLKSIDTLEAVMLPYGLYYISKSSNNTLKGNDPNDRLYYIDYDGMNKKEIYQDLDIYDLKTNENELFFLAISEEPQVMMVNKVTDQEVLTLHSFHKEELEALGCNWFEQNTFTLLAANADTVYYGIDFNNGEAMNVYAVTANGEKHEWYLNAYDIEGINRSAYFMRGELDEGFLKIVFDCDEEPIEIYLIDIMDKSTLRFEGEYYKPTSIDVEGDYIYYCKSVQPDRYGEMPEGYEYGRSTIAELD